MVPSLFSLFLFFFLKREDLLFAVAGSHLQLSSLLRRSVIKPSRDLTNALKYAMLLLLLFGNQERRR